MADLFNVDEKNTDTSMFEETAQNKPVVDTSSSDKNLIAQASLIEGSDLVQTYTTLSTMGDEDRKLVMSEISRNAKDREVQGQMDLVSSLIQDPSMTEEGKMEYVQALSGEYVKPTNSMKSALERLYTTSTGEESELEERRLATTADLIDPITELMSAKQKAVNALAFDEDTGEGVSFLNNPGDLAELFLPFTEQVYAAQINNALQSGEISTFEDFFNFLFLGEAKMFSKEMYDKAPLEAKLAFLEAAPQIFNEAKTLVFMNDNDLLQLDNFLSVVQEGYYGQVDRLIDDGVSLLDMAGLGPLVKPVGRALGLRKAAEFAKSSLRRTASKKQPASVQSLSEQVNPEVARKLASAVDEDVTGEAAEALTGASRTEAQVEMHGPQVRTEDGSVLSKPYALDRDILAAAYEETGRIFRTPDELSRTSEILRTDRADLNGMIRNDQLSTTPVIKDNGTLDISEVYHPQAGGWTDPKQAIKETLENLEHYGVKEEDLILMRKSGDEYVETTTKEVVGLKTVKSEALGEKAVPADQSTLSRIEEDFIKSKKEELMADTSSRLVRGDRKQLLKEKRELEEALSRVVDEPVGKPAKGKDVSARKAKKEAAELAARLTDEEKAIYKERISLINSKLKASKIGEEAEADLTRLEQGIVPTKYRDELQALKDKAGTVQVTKRTELPGELSAINLQDDYAVKANFNYLPRATEIARDDLDVKLNFLDTLSSKAPTPGKATASRYLFQSSYMLDPVVYQGSVAAVDQGTRLQKVIMDKARVGFFEPIEQLDKAKQQRIGKIIHDQNMARKNYTKDELADLGVVDEAELTILDNWKFMNDQLWHLINRDLATTLRNNGSSVYTDTVSGDRLVGKAMPANTPLSQRPVHAYDPVDGKTKLTSNTFAELDRTGGHIFELRHPEMIGEVEVSHIIVRGGDSNRYIKSIQQDDVILPYVEGHSHIRYKDNFFIERQMIDENGRKIGKPQAIMTAPDTTSALKAIKRLDDNASNALKGRTWQYTARNDNALTAIEISERHFDVATASGLSSQRKRGQTLRSYDSSRITDMAPVVADPLDSFKASVAELSKRVPMREYLDDLEQRIISKSGKHLPTDDFGRPRLPSGGEKLTKGDIAGEAGARSMGDARTMIEHYNYMKFGYMNSLDNIWKKGLNKISQYAGAAGRRLGPKGEKVGRKAEEFFSAAAEEISSPVGVMRGTAFNAHIAMSAPPSQWMVQGLPAFTNGILHPEYVFSGKVVSDWRKLILGMVHEGDAAQLRKTMGKAKADEILQLKAEWDRTGLGAGVDKHLIVESGVEHLIETERFRGIKELHEGVFGKFREIGFDKGEIFNLGTFWLAARNDAIQKGAKMDNARDFDMVRAKTRALTMNMNKAGEMPWNKDSMSLLTQFMISPYKSLTMYLDRSLTAQERGSIAAWQFMMMPLPVFMTYHLRASVGVEGTEGDLATEVITNGILGGMVNTAANYVFEDAGSASWQRNVQNDPTYAGILTVLHTLTEEQQGTSFIQALAQQSPSLSMVSGYNPVLANLASSVGGLIAAPFYETNEDKWTAMKMFAGENGALWQYSAFARGMSSAYKELFTAEAGKRYSAISGKVQDEDVSVMESMARAFFGMETTWQTISRQANMELYDGSQEAYNDADLLYKEISREATINGFNMNDPKRAEYILRHFNMAFPDGRMPPKMSSYLMRKLDTKTSLGKKLLSGYGLGIEEQETVRKALGNATPELKQMNDFFHSEDGVNAIKGAD